MATLSFWSGYQFTSGSEQITGGSRSGSYSISVDGQFAKINKSLATATTWVAWESGSDCTTVTDFDFLWILSDKAIEIELTVDKAGAAATPGPTISVMQAQANIPFIVTSDDAYAGPTANFASGTESVINRIRIRNISGSTAVITGVIVT